MNKQGNPSIIPWAFQQIRSLYSNTPRLYFEYIKQNARKSKWINKFFAGHEISFVYSQDPEDSIRILKSLSGSETEIVREGAARSWARLLNESFNEIFAELEDMSDSNKFELRYTAALSPVLYYNEKSPSKSEKHRIENFWRAYENDDRQGLRNLVRTQILEKYVEE